MFLSQTVNVENSDKLWLTLPDELWSKSMLSDHSRFDFIVRSDGSLLLRPCPFTLEQYKSRKFAPGHPDDSEWTTDSLCGLVKWVCPTCKDGILVEEEDFPPGWVEISSRKENGDTSGVLTFCSMGCLAKKAKKLAKNSSALPPWTYPGF